MRFTDLIKKAEWSSDKQQNKFFVDTILETKLSITKQ